jgi:lysophospholipase L1-like esterase
MRIYKLLKILIFLLITTNTGVCQETINANRLNIQYCKNWELFKNKYRQINLSPSNKITILFLGDSHIQGGYSTNRFRNLWSEKSNKVGRGFIFPYHFAHTNGPEDIEISSSANWISGKWNNPKENIRSPFGYEITTDAEEFNMSISYKPNEKKYTFQKITLFHSPDSLKIISGQVISNVTKELTPDIYYTSLYLKVSADSCLLDVKRFHNSQNFKLFSIFIENQDESVSLNSIGINGISFQQYNQKIELNPWLTFLKPDLIILALGTNDAFAGKLNKSGIENSITNIIHDIRKIVPNAAIIITTPNDYLIRKKYINPRIPEICELIKNTAKVENCGWWDFFSIMGNSGSSKKWYHQGLLFKDYIHLSKEGYKYQGELFYNALQKALEHN